MPMRTWARPNLVGRRVGPLGASERPSRQRLRELCGLGPCSRHAAALGGRAAGSRGVGTWAGHQRGAPCARHARLARLRLVRRGVRARQRGARDQAQSAERAWGWRRQQMLRGKGGPAREPPLLLQPRPQPPQLLPRLRTQPSLLLRQQPRLLARTQRAASSRQRRRHLAAGRL